MKEIHCYIKQLQMEKKKVCTIRSHLKYVENNNEMKEGIIIISTVHVMTLRTREVCVVFRC